MELESSEFQENLLVHKLNEHGRQAQPQIQMQTQPEHTQREYEYKKRSLKYTKTKLIKNLVVISLSWVFLFIGFFSLANLQSSLNSNQNLGTISLSCIYAALIVGSSFFPKLIIDMLGLKWTIIASQIAYIIYIFANMCPSWFTLIPASILLGFAASSLWVSKNLYVNEISKLFITSSDQDHEVILNRCFSLFYAIFLSAQIWANLISSVILKPEVDVHSVELISNSTLHCGANGCPGSLYLPTLKKPKLSSVYILCGILSASVFISILINALFLTDIKKTSSSLSSTFEENDSADTNTAAEGDNVSKTSKKSSSSTSSSFKVLFRLMFTRNQILITPFSMWVGFVHAFAMADFTRYFVACLFGVHKVGYYVMFYGVSLTIGCLIFGTFVKFVGRIICLFVGALFYFSVLAFLLTWKVTHSEYYVLYFVAFTLGLAVSFWEPNLNASIAIFFPSSTEEAFSLYKLWESAGFFIAYLMSGYVCVWIKIYILIFSAIVGFLGYLCIEILRKYKHFSL